MFRTLLTTRTQKRGVFRSFTKAAEPVCCASAYTAERVSYWEDIEDNLFLPNAYMTYDNWIWPDYFRIFIENNSNINIDEEFLRYIDDTFTEYLECSLDEARKFYIDNCKK